MTTLSQSDLDDLLQEAQIASLTPQGRGWRIVLSLLDYIAQLTAERDEKREYGGQARIRENEAEQHRISLSFEVAKLKSRIAELEAELKGKHNVQI